MVMWKWLLAAAMGVAVAAGCRQASNEQEGATMTPEAAAIKTAHRIEWLPWDEAAFRRARDEDKLVLVDSGATWCHWCHVMDRVTYENADVADLISKRFVPVRIDRDRQPEVGSACGGLPRRGPCASPRV